MAILALIANRRDIRALGLAPVYAFCAVIAVMASPQTLFCNQSECACLAVLVGEAETHTVPNHDGCRKTEATRRLCSY